jgi:hypothetical protein
MARRLSILGVRNILTLFYLIMLTLSEIGRNEFKKDVKYFFYKELRGKYLIVYLHP